MKKVMRNFKMLVKAMVPFTKACKILQHLQQLKQKMQ